MSLLRWATLVVMGALLAAAPVAGDEPGKDVPPVDARAASEEATRLLARPAYRFCHDPAFPLGSDEAAWCTLDDVARARCPALDAACQRRRDRHDTSDGARWLPAVGSLAIVLFWAIVLAIVALALLLIVRAVFRGGLTLTPAAPDDRGAAELLAQPAPELEPERDAARLLAAARAADAAGDALRATGLAYAALLRHLEGHGLLRLRHDRTNGDYLSALVGRPELQGELRQIVHTVERVQFGAAPATSERFLALLARISSLLARPLVLAWLAVALGAGCGGSRGPEAASPRGRSALRALLAAHQIEPRHRISPLERLDETTRTLLITVPLSETEWDHVAVWVERGGLAVVALDALPERFGLSLHDSPRASGGYSVASAWYHMLGEVRALLPAGRCLTVERQQAIVGKPDCWSPCAIKRRAAGSSSPTVGCSPTRR